MLTLERETILEASLTAAAHELGIDPSSSRGQAGYGGDLSGVLHRIYLRGDRLTTRFVLSHAVLTLLLAPIYGTWAVSLIWGAINVAIWLTVVRLAPGHFFTRASAGVILESFCALHIWQMHGQPEQHFWFFVGFTMMIVYQDWICMWPGALLIIAQHTIFATLHNHGMNLHFFPEAQVDFIKLTFHFGIALVHVAVCGYWAWLLRQQTIRDTGQKAELLASRRTIESQLESTQASETALRQMAGELTLAHGELERDIAERRRTEERLRSSEQGMQMALDAAEMISWRLDGATGGLEFSVGAHRWFGLEAAAMPGSLDDFQRLVHEEDRERIGLWYAAALSGEDERRVAEYRIVRPDGDVRWVVQRGQIFRGPDQPTRMLGVVIDVTERKEEEARHRQIELKIQHAQKLESLGILAGGVAHDFNNLLVGILGNASLARHEVPPASPAADTLRDIEHAAHRAADLTRQMLAYSGRGKFVVEPVSVTTRLREMAPLVTSIIDKKAELRLVLEEDLPPITADPSQLDQVIMNLIINASESLSEQGGPVVVRTGVVALDEAALAEFANGDAVSPGPLVFLEVEDTGEGMTRATLERVFDPFFTTKFTGRGLGLAAVLGILRGHGGAIRVRTTSGKGSTFTVVFPIAEVARPAKQAVLPTPSPERWQGSGLILVVDDEAGIRKLAKRLLSRHGFEVETAEDGVAGLELFTARKDDTVLVLLDRTMPGLSGDEVLEEIHRIRPEVPVLISSGYTEPNEHPSEGRNLAAGFVAKPYLAADLIAAVRRTLATTQTGGTRVA